MPKSLLPRRSVLILSPGLPSRQAADAGTRYLQLLSEALAAEADVTFLVPDFDSNRTGADTPVGQRVLRSRSAVTRSVARWLHLRVSRVDPTLPYLPFVLELLRRDVRAELRRADVVDLQWSDMLRLARLVRWLSPRARVVATHHDVLSQRYTRWTNSASSPRQRVKWSWAARLAKRAEVRSAQYVDATVTFSEKDAVLLRSGSRLEVTVVDPPMARVADAGKPLSERAPVVVFVGYLARAENDDAARWLLEDIWPAVAHQVSGAQLWLVGSGAGESLTQAAGMRDEVQLTGFVDDLDAVYRESRVCVVPLRHGAGVKFKTIEAMSAGTPVVTTPLGAEGISGAERFACLSDETRLLVAGLVEALIDPDQSRADSARAWAQDRYGMPRFHSAVRTIYGAGTA